jgi:hypothetical protein
MKRIYKLQIVDLKDERSDLERELTTEEAKKIVGGAGASRGDEDNDNEHRPKQCKRKNWGL